MNFKVIMIIFESAIFNRIVANKPHFVTLKCGLTIDVYAKDSGPGVV